MHVGFVCSEYPAGLSANGVSTYTAIMAEEMARQGHLVSVFCHTSGDRAGEEPRCSEGIRVHRMSKKSFGVPLLRVVYYRAGGWLLPGYFQHRDGGRRLREAVSKAHREQAIDVLECPEVRGVSSWLQSLGIPVVVRLHTSYVVGMLANGARMDRYLRGVARAEQRCLRNATILSAPSHAVVAETRKVLRISMEEVCVVPNPVTMPRWNGVDPKGFDSREILFVGSTALVKGFDVLIKAFRCLAERRSYEDVRLKVVGPDYGLFFQGKRAIPGREFVASTIENLNTASRIVFVGRLPYEQVQGLRVGGRVTVVPSRFESFAYTVSEAMAAGCPVVASDAGGLPEIVQHDRNGLLFRSGDWRDLARQLERLLADSALRAGLAARARADVRERYSAAVVGAQMAEFYKQVIDRFGGRGGARSVRP